MHSWPRHPAAGTGKTLIARQIGKMLNGKEPKIVNGPEVLNKYVGASEENIRNLFKVRPPPGMPFPAFSQECGPTFGQLPWVIGLEYCGRWRMQ